MVLRFLIITTIASGYAGRDPQRGTVIKVLSNLSRFTKSV